MPFSGAARPVLRLPKPAIPPEAFLAAVLHCAANRTIFSEAWGPVSPHLRLSVHAFAEYLVQQGYKQREDDRGSNDPAAVAAELLAGELPHYKSLNIKERVCSLVTGDSGDVSWPNVSSNLAQLRAIGYLRAWLEADKARRERAHIQRREGIRPRGTTLEEVQKMAAMTLVDPAAEAAREEARVDALAGKPILHLDDIREVLMCVLLAVFAIGACALGARRLRRAFRKWRRRAWRGKGPPRGAVLLPPQPLPAAAGDAQQQRQQPGAPSLPEEAPRTPPLLAAVTALAASLYRCAVRSLQRQESQEQEPDAAVPADEPAARCPPRRVNRRNGAASEAGGAAGAASLSADPASQSGPAATGRGGSSAVAAAGGGGARRRMRGGGCRHGGTTAGGDSSASLALPRAGAATAAAAAAAASARSSIEEQRAGRAPAAPSSPAIPAAAAEATAGAASPAPASTAARGVAPAPPQPSQAPPPAAAPPPRPPIPPYLAAASAAAAAAAAPSLVMPSTPPAEAAVGDSSTIAKSPTCVVCLESPSTHIIVPCGHQCLCEGCTESFVSSFDFCPMCREKAVLKPVRVRVVT